MGATPGAQRACNSPGHETVFGERHRLLQNYHNVESFLLWIWKQFKWLARILLSQTLIKPLMFHFDDKKFQSICSRGTECVSSNTLSTICFVFLSRKTAEQPSVFSSVAIAIFPNGYKLLAPCCSPRGCKEGPEERSQKTVHKIFPGFLSILCLLFPPLPLVERRNSFLEGQMVYIYLDEMS